MHDEDDADVAEGLPGSRPKKRTRSGQMVHEVSLGVPGAVALAVVDIARSPNNYPGLDAIFVFLGATGWKEAYALAFEPYGGFHPLDPRSTATEQQRARVLGAGAQERAFDNQEFFRTVWEKAADGTHPFFPLARSLAIELCNELDRAFAELAAGDYESARARRRGTITKWNDLVDQHWTDRYPLPRLCEHCGKPMVLAARERTGSGPTLPAKVHGQCKKAFRSAMKRQR